MGSGLDFLRLSRGTLDPLFTTMRIVTYNPMSCVMAGRYDDITRNLRQFHVIALIGTRYSQERAGRIYSCWHINGYLGIHWGFKKTATFSNSSTGVSLLLKGQKKKYIREILSPPPELQGRAGAVQVWMHGREYRHIVAYVPPPPSVANETIMEEWRQGGVELEDDNKNACELFHPRFSARIDRSKIRNTGT